MEELVDERVEFVKWAFAIGLSIGLFMFALMLPFLIVVGIAEGVKALWF